MKSSAAQMGRACDVLLATAAGDALGAPFEFGDPLGPDVVVDIDDAVSAGSMWETGEWTDDTSMAIAIAEVAVTGADLRNEAPQDAIVDRWCQWDVDPPRIRQRRCVRVVVCRDPPRGAHRRAGCAGRVGTLAS
jgi:ADP-ribosylglycohydrolase